MFILEFYKPNMLFIPQKLIGYVKIIDKKCQLAENIVFINIQVKSNNNKNCF